jgi:ubiquinone/menaquinone biosynthesis C-methylase UbiE
MTVQQKTLWEQFLQPIVRNFIDEEKLKQFYENVDWEAEASRFRQPDLEYPQYYQSQNFHGIEGGYLSPGASVTYDPITQYVLPPNEIWVREELVKRIKGQPRRLLDLGCGTGSTTLLLQTAFPNAEVVGLDLSPYMLFMAEYKAKEAGLDLQLCHGLAEATDFPPNSFDVVTASLLFHETPPTIAKAILREAFRLLTPGGQVAILDGNQKVLHQTEWLTNIFEEPYIRAYAAEEVNTWMENAGFEAVRTTDIWWVHQVTTGMKPLPIQDPVMTMNHGFADGTNPVPAF